MIKRKPWRTFKKTFLKNSHIRCICIIVMVAEGILLHHQKVFRIPTIEVRDRKEIVIYHLPEENKEEAKELSPNRIYGIRIRLKDGVIDFYRREE